MPIDKLLRNFIIIGVFSLLLIPLVVTPALFFPFITGKNFVFRLVVELIFGAWLVLAIWSPVYRPRRSFLIWSFATLVGISFLASWHGGNFFRSFWSNFERMDGLITLLHLLALLIVISAVFTTHKLWRSLLTGVVISGLPIFLFSLCQLSGSSSCPINQGGVRLDATFGNAAYLAVYLMFLIFLGFYLFISEAKKNWGRWGYVALSLIYLIPLYFTATRGPILGLLGGSFITIALLVWQAKGQVRKYAIKALIILLVLVGLFFVLRNTAMIRNNPVLNRFAAISMSETTTESRFLVWQMSWQGFKEKPVLGWGAENYSQVFAKYYHPKMWRQEPWFDRSHNVVFDWLINAGLLGLVTYLSIFIISVWGLWRYAQATPQVVESMADKKNKNKKYAPDRFYEVAVLVGLLAGYFFQNLFVFDNITSYLLFIIVIAFIDFLIKSDNQITDTKQPATSLMVAKDSWLQPGLTVVALGLTLVGAYFLNAKPIMAAMLLPEALHPQQKADKTLKIFQDIFKTENLGSRESREQYLTQVAKIMADTSLDSKLQQEFLTLAYREMEKHLTAYPPDARTYLIYGSFYSRYDRYDDALLYLNKAKELSPQKQAILFELGSAYINSDQMKKGIAVLRQAYELEPNYPEAKKIYAVASIINKDFTTADLLLADLLKQADGDTLFDDRLVKAYLIAGEQGKAESLINLRFNFLTNKIKNHPQEVSYYFRLADLFNRLGKKEEAWQVLVEAKDKFKTNEATLKLIDDEWQQLGGGK